MLCTQVLNGLASALGVLQFDVGQEFDVVTVSFDPGETPELARAKKATYVERYNRPGAEAGWHFLTGADDVDRRADAGGRVPLRLRRERRAVRARERDHGADAGRHAVAATSTASSTARATCGSRSSRPSERKIGTLVDQLLLLCFHYDPKSGTLQRRGHAAGAVGGRGRPCWRSSRGHRGDAAAGQTRRARSGGVTLRRLRDRRCSTWIRHPVLSRAGVHDGAARGQPVLLPDRGQRVLRGAGDGARHRLRDQVPAPPRRRGRARRSTGRSRSS